MLIVITSPALCASSATVEAVANPPSSYIPMNPNLPKLVEAARGCKACALWKRGTQTVFGEGGRHARVMFVGEQPGDKEDLLGKPFVGPAGKLLDKCLEMAGRLMASPRRDVPSPRCPAPCRRPVRRATVLRRGPRHWDWDRPWPRQRAPDLRQSARRCRAVCGPSGSRAQG